MTASSKLFNTFVLCALLFSVFSFALTAPAASADTTSILRPVADGRDDASWKNTAKTSCSTAECYIEVDELSGANCTNSDGDASYISSDTAGNSQTFNLDMSGITDGWTVTNIVITACYSEGDTRQGSFQTRYCHNGSCADSGVSFVGDSVYNESTQNHLANFTKTSGSNIEIGVTQTRENKKIYISQLSAVITYIAPATDTTPPSVVSDLTLSNPSNASMVVSWTAQGDDGSTGTATTYDLRYSTVEITDLNWSEATPATGEPLPSSTGSSESMTVSGLLADTLYYFAIKTSDEVPNESVLSNVPSLSTSDGVSVTIPGGAGAVAPSAIIFSGRAYPESSIEVLTRGILDELINVPLEVNSVDESGLFVAQTLGLLGEAYFVGLQITDKNENKTDLISFDVNLLEKNLIVGDLVIPPTMHIETQEVKIGEDVHISGYGIPETTLELTIDDEIMEVYELVENGSYSVMYNVSDLSVGTHYVRVRVVDSVNDVQSAFSSPRAFKITALTFPEADLNKDDKVNITDWSIFLSKWGSDDKDVFQSIDLNKDGRVDVSDLSIFLKAINI